MATKIKRRTESSTFTGSVELWKTLLRGVPDFACILDTKGRFLFVNRLLSRLKLSDVIGKPVYDFISPESVPAYREHFERVVRTGEPCSFQTRGVSESGFGIYDNHIAPLQDERGGMLIATVSRDVTDREKSKQELRSREALLKVLIAGAQDYAIFMLDHEAKIVNWNEGAARIFGWSSEEATGKPLDALYPEKDRRDAERLVWRAAEEGRAEAETWQLRKNGTSFWSNCVVTALREDGVLRGFACVTRDITERKRMEREILEAGAREQRRIAQDLHDSLGQKLTGIALIAQVLEGRLTTRALPEAEDARKIAGYSTQAVREARELAQGLLPAELGGGLSEALRSLSSYAREALRVECEVHLQRGVEAPDELAAVHLYRIAQEAVNNAVRHGKAQRVDISLAIADGRVTLTVQDDGTGIPPQRRRKAGLGLGIMQYRARMMGASLEVRRSKAVGTVLSCAVARPT
ncbi:MAG: PAS domain S-box protein [Elusimicrobia bacterium]|nr:PAS domain S-box protein [Elusimicrobiota bacterium]